MNFSPDQISAAKAALAQYISDRSGLADAMEFDASGAATVTSYGLRYEVTEPSVGTLVRVVNCGVREGWELRFAYVELSCGLVLCITDRESPADDDTFSAEVTDAQLLPGIDAIAADAAGKSARSLSLHNADFQRLITSLAKNLPDRALGSLDVLSVAFERAASEASSALSS